MMKLPELWDIQTRRKVEQPDMTKAHAIQHSSYSKADKYEIAIAAMPQEAQMRYARALYTYETLAIIIQSAMDGKPVLASLPDTGHSY
jgi:hypothetical protein